MRNSNEVSRLAGWQSGSCRGLQILVHRFNSGTGLQKFIHYRILFRLSSAVEQSAVNRLVACSNQAAGAIKKHHLLSKMVFFFMLLDTGSNRLFDIRLEDENNRCSGCFYRKRRSFIIKRAMHKQAKIYKTSDRRAVSECFARTY